MNEISTSKNWRLLRIMDQRFSDLLYMLWWVTNSYDLLQRPEVAYHHTLMIGQQTKNWISYLFVFVLPHCPRCVDIILKSSLTKFYLMMRVLQFTDVSFVILRQQIFQYLVVAVMTGDMEGRVANVINGRWVSVRIKKCLDNEKGRWVVFWRTSRVQRCVALLKVDRPA